MQSSSRSLFSRSLSVSLAVAAGMLGVHAHAQEVDSLTPEQVTALYLGTHVNANVEKAKQLNDALRSEFNGQDHVDIQHIQMLPQTLGKAIGADWLAKIPPMDQAKLKSAVDEAGLAAAAALQKSECAITGVTTRPRDLAKDALIATVSYDCLIPAVSIAALEGAPDEAFYRNVAAAYRKGPLKAHATGTLDVFSAGKKWYTGSPTQPISVVASKLFEPLDYQLTQNAAHKVSSFATNPPALKMGSSKEQIEKALKTTLIKQPISSFRTYFIKDFRQLKAALPETYRDLKINSAEYSFDKNGKLWRLYVQVDLPADDAFAAFEKTSDILSEKYKTGPIRKGIDEQLPVIESCYDSRVNGGPVGDDFKGKWKDLTQPQRQAFIMNCGGATVPFFITQKRNSADVVEVVSFERINVGPFGIGTERAVSEYLAKPVKARLGLRVIQTSKSVPSFVETEKNKVEY